MTTKQRLWAMRVEYVAIRNRLVLAGMDTEERIETMKHVERLCRLIETGKFHRTWLDPLWDWLDRREAGLRKLIGRE